MNARDFELAELEASHAQAVNLVMNGSSELNSKLKQFSNSINQKLEGYLADNSAIYQLLQRCNNSGNINHFQNQTHLSLSPNQSWQQETCVCHNCDTSPNTQEPKQKQSLTNILSATVMENESLAAIFPFKIEELTETPLFNRAVLEEKPIMAIYTDAKIDDKPANWEWEEIDKEKGKEKKEETNLISSTYSSYTYTSLPPSNYYQLKLECIDCSKKLLSMGNALDDQNDKESGITNHVLHVELSYLTKECGMTFLGMEKCAIRHANTPY
ncbi:hypothetical protein G9A89_014920 [Geosiphon pyriformis]|nr:hypothetical protein G9A89_014920 [Geosiphon pyriformis]